MKYPVDHIYLRMLGINGSAASHEYEDICNYIIIDVVDFKYEMWDNYPQRTYRRYFTLYEGSGQ